MEEEMKLLLKIIKTQSIPNNKWINSTFGDIKIMTNTYKGEIGEELVYELCKSYVDKNAKRNPKSRDSWDINILNKTVEVKTATEDTTGCFQFNGIRTSRQYDFLLVLGISPSEIYFNVYSSSDVNSQKVGNLAHMQKDVVGSEKLTRKKSDLYDISKFKDVLKRVIK